MAFTVRSAIAPAGDALYYTDGFRNHLESYLNILKMINVRRDTVPPALVHQFEGNLYGYLAYKGERHELFWIIMRLSGFHNPHEFGRKQLERANPTMGVELLYPDLNLIGNIRTLYLGKKN